MQTRVDIGDFSRMTHLSVKALRHYDELGLLEAVAVESGSGHRLYSVDQVPTAQVVRRLRDLNMALDEVKRVLRAPDVNSRNRAILDHLQLMEDQLGQTKATVASLRRLLEGPPARDVDVVFRSVPRTNAIAIRERVTVLGRDAWRTAAFEELHHAALSSGLDRSGPDGALYANEWFEDEVGDVVAFMPIARPVEVAAGLRVEQYEVPAAELAVLVHSGSLGDIDQTFGALGKFVFEHTIGGDGPIREYYLVTTFDADDEQSLRTEVAWPIQQTAAR